MDENINSPVIFSSDEEQLVLMTELNAEVVNYSIQVDRSFDQGQLPTVVDGACKLIEILRTSELTPKNYYVLYHAISSCLLSINQNLQEEERYSNQCVSELFETIQYLPGCMNRLYLMITVGPELVRRKIIKFGDMLDDLSFMARAAQDPIRALFLRHYLLSIFKQYLLDSNENELDRSLNFLLINFAQMNRMWVRIEDIMASDARKEQRAEFSVLIGTNIQRISSLNGITVEKYLAGILPFLIKHVELCEDAMAQEFILKSIIYAFPEEFHIATVDQLFNVFSKVEQGVKILDVLNQLLERFLQYIGHLVDPQNSSALFVIIAKNIEELFNAEGHLSLTAKFKTLQKLLRFALKINKNDVKNVRNLMKFTDFHIDISIGNESLQNQESSKKLRKFLELPLAAFDSPNYLFKVEFLPKLVGRLMINDRIIVSTIICRKFLDSNTKITNSTEMLYLISCTDSLVREYIGSSCFFSIIHLVSGNSSCETISLLLELHKNIKNMSKSAAERYVIPMGVHLLEYYTKNGNYQPALDFLKSFLSENEEIYPSKALCVYMEAYKLAISKRSEAEISEYYNKVLECLSRLTKPKHVYYAFKFVVNYFSTIKGNFQNLFEILNGMVDKIAPIKMRTELHCAFILFHIGQMCDSSFIMDRLEMTMQDILVSGSDISRELSSYYILLDTTITLLDNQVRLNSDWLIKILSVISAKHREILESGKNIDSAVSNIGKKFYINLAKYIQSRNYIKDD